ncbi:MAG: hypothetical protein HKP58_08065 [Desulfatitalea sp.]|nr:hypothetical protein [Desulfatitalea sp.]NNK00355.1 hypothetical protein [Desulfatitalea sp.]
MTEKHNTEDNLDHEWATRTLCSDESCIGVIGPDARCNACGMPFEGEPLAAFPPDDRPEAEAPHTAATSADPGETTDPAEPVMNDEWENRTLCSDESCIGIIGPDGRCNACGMPSTRATDN